MRCGGDFADFFCRRVAHVKRKSDENRARLSSSVAVATTVPQAARLRSPSHLISTKNKSRFISSTPPPSPAFAVGSDVRGFRVVICCFSVVFSNSCLVARADSVTTSVTSVMYR